MTAQKAQPKIEQYEDLYTDLAGTHHLSERPALSQETARDLAALRRDGFLILERLIAGETMTLAREALENSLGPLGRNVFEGLRTQRSYALLRKTRSLDAVAAHPRVLALTSAACGPDPLLSACLAIRIHPGETRQLAHFDCGFYPIPRPRPCVGVSAIWAFDPFTDENGATVVWPGSHAWDDARRPSEGDPGVPIVMPAGSVLVLDGDLWHAGGANRSSAPRLALTPQYCANWLRTIENMSLAVPPEIVAELPDPLQRLLGYAVRPPFMGYVDGVHPKRLLKKPGVN
jgi:ectoine hydroxylase-related dioxygenase (phytanoyl-CoA dioxygenase family)